MQRHKLTPSREMEVAIMVINQAMNYAGIPYWLCFGGLWALIKNNGIVPDGDFDICTYYSQDYTRIAKTLRNVPGRYVMTKALVDDTDRSKALYCSFGSEEGFPHICLSFWYLHDGIRYYCHDQRHEVEGIGVPSSGYSFRGIPAASVDDDPNNFKMVEWPGVNQQAKIRVPRFPGMILDNLYPDWAYKMQKYEVGDGVVDEERMASYHRGGAISPYAVEVKSMRDFGNSNHIAAELVKSRSKWNIRLKTGR